MKATLEGINSRARWHKNAQSVGKRKNNGNYPIRKSKKQKQAEQFKDLWSNIKYTNIHSIEVPGGEDQEKYWKWIWGNCGWKLSKLEKGNRSQRNTVTTEGSKLDEHRPTQDTLELKWQNLKTENAKNSKRKTVIFQRNLHKSNSWFFSRKFAGQKGGAWDIYSTEREKTCNLGYSAQ